MTTVLYMHDSMKDGCFVYLLPQEYLESRQSDNRRTTVKEPFSLATKGLKNKMEKLGSINKRHEDLVRRVDALEALLVSYRVYNCFFFYRSLTGSLLCH